MDPAFALPPAEPDRVLFSCELFYDDVSGQSQHVLDAARARVRRISKKRAHAG